MTLKFDKESAMKALPYIDDPALFRAVSLALWLYIDQNWTLVRAVKKAAEKHSVKPRSAIEDLLRQVIPAELIAGRSQANVISHQKLRRMEIEGEIHLDDIIKSKP